MKILQTLFFPFKKANTINPEKVAKAKAQLASLSQEDLLTVMHRETKKTSDLAAKLGLRKSVPTVVQALSELHREATYMRDGRSAPQTIFVDVWRNAYAYVNKRNQVAVKPTLRQLEAMPLIKWDVGKWAEWQARATKRPDDKAAAKMSNLEYYVETQKALGEQYVNEWAGIGKKVSFDDAAQIIPTPKKKVAFARTDSSESVERGGLAFDPQAPVSVTGLVTKLDKKEGKKADR